MPTASYTEAARILKSLNEVSHVKTPQNARKRNISQQVDENDMGSTKAKNKKRNKKLLNSGINVTPNHTKHSSPILQSSETSEKDALIQDLFQVPVMNNASG